MHSLKNLYNPVNHDGNLKLLINGETVYFGSFSDLIKNDSEYLDYEILSLWENRLLVPVVHLREKLV